MAAQKALPADPLVESSGKVLLNPKDDNFQLIHRAIAEIIEEKRNETTSVEEDRLLLSRLLSQLESSKEDSDWQLEPHAEQNEVTSRANIAEVSEQQASNDQGNEVDITSEEIVRELREVKRQNRITHWLLSVMIAVTLAWQLSEVSLILSVKHKVSHPLKTFGGMITGLFKGKSPVTYNEGDSPVSFNGPRVEVPELPSVHMPELPRMNMQSFAMNPED